MSDSRGIFTRWFVYPRETTGRADPSRAEYDDMSEIELRAHARVHGVAGFALLRRPELIAALLAEV